MDCLWTFLWIDSKILSWVITIKYIYNSWYYYWEVLARRSDQLTGKQNCGGEGGLGWYGMDRIELQKIKDRLNVI